MTIRRFDKHKLLVEGPEDRLVLSYLLDSHVVWGDNKEEWLADIQAYEGVDTLLSEGEIETQLKAARLEAIGIIVDANNDLAGRWQTIRTRCLSAFPNLPEEFPDAGLLAVNDDSLRLGVWIMPNNRLSGMLETFLAYLVQEPDNDALWTLALETVETAIHLGAGVRRTHEDKARIHTWLALQDPPGRRLELAILDRILNPNLDNAQPFVDWFIELFQVEDMRRSH